jgi:6-phosphogluconolactonase
VSFEVEIHPSEYWAQAAAKLILESLPQAGSVVLTGGSAAELVYPLLITKQQRRWQFIDLYFSDERCVRPDDPNSNFGLIDRTLLSDIRPAAVHRMRGEEEPSEAARAYEQVVAPAAQRGLDLVLLGVGDDAHIAALFPASPAFDESEQLCLAVRRPDGMIGITLTPRAFLRARRILLLVSGRSKADAVRRAVSGDETPSACPVRVLAGHPDVRFVLDEAAASLL